MVKILQKDDPVLREIALPVSTELLASPNFRKIISDMVEASNSQDDAVAIAAPQIGLSLRIFILAPKVREILKIPDLPLIYINPKFVKKSKDKKLMTGEGCLSVRWLYGSVRRSSRVTIEAVDENGEKISRGASGLLAQIYQHEMDHLDGILFIDKAQDLRDLPPEEIKKRNDE